MSHTIDVATHSQKEYQIRIGSGLGKEMQEFVAARYSGRLGLAVIDEKVERLHREGIEKQLNSCFERVEFFSVPEGEQSKNKRIWNKIVDFSLKSGVERTTPLFAIGGGVTGDLAGFAASSILRGIPLVHIPTTLLAMVDSSIGGKTGINHEAGKNLVGAFYQPEAVFADIRYLETLDRAEWINGLSEILKYGAIHSPAIFETVGKLIDESGFTPSKKWAELVAKSAAIKVEIVKEDTLEKGKRAFLNFGHTFGHALEKEAGYGAVSHGQAVFAGMIAAVFASGKLGAGINKARFEPFEPLYPLQLNQLVPDRKKLIKAMKSDKKVKDGRIRLVLLNEWGSPYIYKCEEETLIEDALDFAFETFN